MAATDRIDYIAVDARRAAAMLGLSKSSFHRLVSSGTIPQGFKLGGKRLWSVSRLAEIVTEAQADVERGTRKLSR